MSRTFLILLLVQLLLILMQLWEVKGDCCVPLYGAICDDDTFGTPCCGYESCNIFCCNCRCRTRSRRRMSDDDDCKRHSRRKHSKARHSINIRRIVKALKSIIN
ncbi:hypothetical protein ACLKA6_000740 [Drosophila palustris]